jgi:hypothetical protein
MKYSATIIYLLSYLLFLFPPLCMADNEKIDNTFEIVSDYTYFIAPDDSREEYESLCLFGAKYKAVALSAKYLNHIGVLKNYGKKKKEIFCLVVDDLKFTIIKKKLIAAGKYYTKIKTKIEVTDFTKAEIKNIELEKQESKFSWQEEMEQYVYKTIEPGKEISRAYRYLRKKDRRIAIIYLNHLQKKYPNWQEIYFARAIGFYAINKIEAMMNALKTSCALGNREACEDLEGFAEHRNGIKIGTE